MHTLKKAVQLYMTCSTVHTLHSYIPSRYLGTCTLEDRKYFLFFDFYYKVITHMCITFMYMCMYPVCMSVCMYVCIYYKCQCQCIKKKSIFLFESLLSSSDFVYTRTTATWSSTWILTRQRLHESSTTFAFAGE